MQEKNRDFSIIKKRIIQYLDSKDISKYEFYQKTGIPNGILSQKGGISEENILKFLSYYNDINPAWLLTGNGNMLLNDLAEDFKPKKPPNETASTCSLCLEKERIIKEMEARLQDKDKIIALLELQLSEYRAKEGERAIMAAAKSSSKLKPTVEKETVPK